MPRPRRHNLVGEVFGNLTVIQRATQGTTHHTRWDCLCICGARKDIRGTSLASGKTKSCGCGVIVGKIKHGLFKSRFWKIWKGMKRRCHSPSLGDTYLQYGGKGIKVCERWHTFRNFMEDMYEEYVVHERIHGKDTQIDRLNPNGNYEPDNCQWVTQKENLARRSFKKGK